MKTRIISLFVTLCVALLFVGCSSVTKQIAEVNETLKEFDRLGIKELDIPGRYTSTTYRTTEGDGKTTSTLIHNNPGLSMPIRMVRERPTVQATPPSEAAQ